MQFDKANLKFAILDTIAATPINLALNFMLISVGMHLGMDAAELTLFITSILFVFAVIRKYILRIYIDKNEHRYES